MSLTKQVNKTWFWCGLILVLAVGVRCYKFTEKEDMFSDEYLSVIISLYHNEDMEFWWYNNVTNDSIAYTGKELKSLALHDDNSLKGVLYDISKLRLSTRDIPHTNLYYSCLRASFLYADTSNISQVMQRGFILNLLFFIVGFFFMYKLASRLFPGKIFVACALAVAFLNPASIGNTLLLRPYQLQETIFILFSYVFVLLCYAIMRKKKIDTWQNMLVLSLVIALTLLTGYFAVFYIFILSLFLLYISYKNKFSVKYLLFVFILAYVFTLSIYAGYNDALISSNSYRVKEATEKLGLSHFIDNIEDSLKGLFSETVNYLWYIPTLILILLSSIGAFISKGNKTLSGIDEKIKYWMPLILAYSGGIWIFIVMFFAPFKLVRYIMPMFPVLSLFIPFILYYYSSKLRYALFAAFSAAILIHTFTTNVCLEAPFIPPAYKNHSEIPLVIGGYEDWLQAGLIPFWTDDRTIEISMAPIEPDKDAGSSGLDFTDKVRKHDALYIIIQNKFSDIYAIPQGYEIEDKFDIGELLRAYKLKKI